MDCDGREKPLGLLAGRLGFDGSSDGQQRFSRGVWVLLGRHAHHLGVADQFVEKPLVFKNGPNHHISATFHLHCGYLWHHCAIDQC